MMTTLRGAPSDDEAELVSPRSLMSRQFANRLPAGAYRYEATCSALSIVSATVVLILLAQAIPDPNIRSIAIVGLLVFAAVGGAVDLSVLDRLRVNSTSYEASSDAVAIARGVLLRTVTVIPARHIVNIQVVHGPILRHLGLVRVRFTTISGSPTLGPLLPEDADAIRMNVVLLTPHDRDDD